jgi:hypothetical protein
MQEIISHTPDAISNQFGTDHAEIYQLIAEQDQIMTTFGLECAVNLSAERVAECLGDLVRASYIRVYSKHNRPSAWETVKEVAQAS